MWGDDAARDAERPFWTFFSREAHKAVVVQAQKHRLAPVQPDPEPSNVGFCALGAVSPPRGEAGWRERIWAQSSGERGEGEVLVMEAVLSSLCFPSPSIPSSVGGGRNDSESICLRRYKRVAPCDINSSK